MRTIILTIVASLLIFGSCTKAEQTEPVKDKAGYYEISFLGYNSSATIKVNGNTIMSHHMMSFKRCGFGGYNVGDTVHISYEWLASHVHPSPYIAIYRNDTSVYRKYYSITEDVQTIKDNYSFIMY